MVELSNVANVETHPFEPFLPKSAKLLMLGTFPPSPKRWCMDWYYPNYTNDMWRIMGLCFFGDKKKFVDESHKTYRLDSLKEFLVDKGIAIFDTCLRIRRTKGTASDKDLEVVEQADLDGMLRNLPLCHGVLTAGQLATNIFIDHYGIANADGKKLKMGCSLEFMFDGRKILLYRQPSSSRAYPMKLEDKAGYYKKMFEELGIK